MSYYNEMMCTRTTFSHRNAKALFLLYSVFFYPPHPSLAADLVSSNYQIGDLTLQYLPPANDGGEAITKYKIEWDAEVRTDGTKSVPSFNPLSQNYGYAEVANVREVQEIIVACRSFCAGTFSLSWGGRVTELPLSVDATPTEVEEAMNYLVEPFSIHTDGTSAVQVTRKANGFAFKWRVTFLGVIGDVGLVKADGDFLIGGGATVRVEEVKSGSGDLYSGAYTNEVQTVFVRKRKGFSCENLSGSFALSFEGKVTSQIDVDTSAVEFKDTLESLDTIHSVNVRTDHHTSTGAGDCSSRSWIVTFTSLVHETSQRAGDIGEMQLSSSSMADPSVTKVQVFENVKGTNPRSFSLVGLMRGLLYYCRVSAYNALGYSVSSSTVFGVPKTQPAPPRNAILSLPDASLYPGRDGTSLKVSWHAADDDGGDAVTDYKIEWYSDMNDFEIQKLTTSSSNGVAEVQSIRISADRDGMSGFFTLAFGGEITELIPHDAEAEGKESVETKLERLATIGNVEVSRELSWTSIPNIMFNLTSGSSEVSRAGGSYSGTLMNIISAGDQIKVGAEVHTVLSVGATSLILDTPYSGPKATSVHIHRWSFGYEWMVTFISHVGEQPLIKANPADNWAGTNPIIEVTRVQKGLQPLGGTFRLGYEGEKTLAIPFDASANLMKQALESLNALGEVCVTRYENNNGYNYFITFLSELGNLEQLIVDESQLTGSNARARVATIVDGKFPSSYGYIITPNINDSPTMEYTLEDMETGVAYFVRISSTNSKGYGYAAVASPSPMRPMRRPSSPTSVTITALSNSHIRMSWRAPEQNGGSTIVKYAVQWDTDPSFPSAWINGFYHEKYVNEQDMGEILYCHTFSIDPASASYLRYGRVLAFNGYKWSMSMNSVVAHAVVGTPGQVRNFNAFASSSIGIMLEWEHPAIDDEETCDFAGDGGSAITHYVIEYDEKADFSSPATSVTVPSSATSFRIGGRDVLTGSKSTILKAGGMYYARIVPFNAFGPGVIKTFPSSIGPLADNAPSAPKNLDAFPASTSSVGIEWSTPTFDGGSAIQEYVIEYDTDSTFGNTPRNTTVAVVREIHALQVGSNESDLNVQIIRATVAVTNEIQSISIRSEGVDEVQKISTTCDDVTAEVQMIATTAVDTNEEQVVSAIADDVDEIQLLRLEGDNQIEIQSVQVSVQRLNEVQKLGIVISHINTAGDGVESTACMGLNVGDPCQDIEAALSGSFTVSFDFDECGGGSDGVNYCQLAVSKYEPNLGTIICSPGLVTDPFSGGDHCVSEPVQHSYSSMEGETGTLQQVLNNLVDDNGISFMTLTNVPGKQEAITVTRQGRIKTRGSCTLDSSGLSPALCSGEYELSYEIRFDAFHTSGDVPPITIVASDFKIDTSSLSYNKMCPTSYYTLGCEEPVGAALDSYHGSFYDGETGSIAIEHTKGAQPSGTISLDYECESSVVSLPNTHFMAVSADGMSATFDISGFVENMALGQWVRFNAGDGLDHYRKIVDIDTVTNSVFFESRAPVLGASYVDVEYGDYFSDWAEANGESGVSSHCAGSRIHATLPIFVEVHSSSVSETDWRGKIGTLSVIDSSGIAISRDVTPDLSINVGLIWDVTFQKQPGNVHQLVCKTLSGYNECSVITKQDSTIIGGSFKLETMWPHEYITDSPQLFQSDAIRWNVNPTDMKNALESVTDADNNKVFGTVYVTRTPYIPTSHFRWSGGYLWTVTFASRGGNIPALTYDESALIGTNIRLAVSDEDSGDADLFQGQRNNAVFSNNDPGLARDGNQITGSFSLYWPGNTYHGSVVTAPIFTVQTGGSSPDRYTALSADAFKSLFEEHVLQGSTDQVDVIRSQHPTQWMGYSYTIKFRHEDLGGDVPGLIYVAGSTLGGRNSYVRINETVKGTELVGTFQLRFEGETTRPIAHDAAALDIQHALNELSSIAPSAVTVSGGASPVRSGPSNGVGGFSTQVKGRIWYVTFASNVWRDPTVLHDTSFVPGNWVGPPASSSDVWPSGSSKAWGKNVGNVPMISCLQSGLSTTNGVLPANGCSVSEIIEGTDPVGGVFKICLDSASNPNGIMSVESDSCTDFIAHNAVASAVESGGDGSSVEEKLESLENVGDVLVTRSSVNLRNGGYTWTVQFLHDVDAPCEQKDDIHSFCNAPGNVPRLCDSTGATPCNTISLQGTCHKPNSCNKLTVLDATDYHLGIRFPGGNEKQAIFVKDSEYLGWEDGSIVNVAVSKEYRLIIDGVPTECIRHNALPIEMATVVQDVLDRGIGGSVRVVRVRSEDLAENGFVYYLTFYDTNDVPLIGASFSGGSCVNDFEGSQSIVIVPLLDGDMHPSNCEDCVDGIVLRGDFQTFEVTGDSLSGVLAWNAQPVDVKNHLEQVTGRTVHVTRTVTNKYGSIEFVITFSKNVDTAPSGAGNVAPMTVVQSPDSSGRSAHIEINEIARGSDGLSGSFDLDYQASGGPRSFSFDETPRRMQRKLEEMSTIGRVFVTRDCYPSCSSGGWGGNPVEPDTRGGYQWTIHFLLNPGSNNGFAFPPGSGIVHTPAILDSNLSGKDAIVTTYLSSVGSIPITGTFKLAINGEETGSIPHNIDANSLREIINDLQSVGNVSVKSGYQTNFRIPGITATVTTDGTVASVIKDLQEHIAPGSFFRIGGTEEEFDGAELVGSVSMTPLSPILSDVHLTKRNKLFVGEKVRIAADTFTIAKNGVEVQQLTVHRSSGIVDGEAYQLSVSFQGRTEVTSCLTFDASAESVEATLNELPILFENGGVSVTRTGNTSGFIGNAHYYKIYFVGEQLLGDVEEIIPEPCVSGVPPGMDSTNSLFHIRTLIQGGKTEHQRITLASDSGSINDTPFFQFSITDSNSNSWTSPCFKWGLESLDISSLIDSTAFSVASLSVGENGVSDLGDARYKVDASHFVEGTLLIGDFVNPGKKCIGRVLSIGEDGKSFFIEAWLGCTAVPGDDIFVGTDIAIIDSFTDNESSISELTLLSTFADAKVEFDGGLYKLNVDFNGITRHTSCLRFGVSAEEMQQEIGLLFDFNNDGLINSDDANHVHVTRMGDGSASSGYGFIYKFWSKGSTTIVGSSSVLGSHAPKFSVVDIGSDGGCSDSGMEDILVTSTASTTDNSNIILLGLDASLVIHAGAKLRASSSLDPSKVYTVDHTSVDGKTLLLTENFEGTSTTAASLHLMRGGSPRFDAQIVRDGRDEFVYDIFFTGAHWKNVPQIQVNTFGDGSCPASFSDIADGMNRNIGVRTLSDGGGKIDLGSYHYVIDRYARPDQAGAHDLFIIPPSFLAKPESVELQRILVIDDDNASLWSSGQPSYKLSFGGEYTECISYNALDTDLETALNSLICSGVNPCVTVTRRKDAARAPNGYVYTLYFESSAVGTSGLQADTSHPDCNAFDLSAGEKIVIEAVGNAKMSYELTANQVPFVDHWFGESRANLPIYRVSGAYWLVRFEQSIGIDMAVSPDTLSGNVHSSAELMFKDVNLNHAVISGLWTGIPYYFRTFSRSSYGFSPPSNVISAIPCGRPEKMKNVSSGHASHQREVQSVTIAASHQKEVQAIQTSAMPIPEVQEVSFRGTPDRDSDGNLFSLRHPEIQVVKWSSGSPVTSGSFSMNLMYVDRVNSELFGAVMYKELQSSCISFDASAEELKQAIETNAVLNGLTPGSVRVTRSSNRSYSSNYGYTYRIHFVGSNVRGNVHQFTSDLGLTGMDTSGGTTCEAFVSSTNDAFLEIWTENESRALGTDTPRLEILLDTNAEIVSGSYQLSVTHFGSQRTTDCIPWNASPNQVKAALENLDNIDFVRVDREGDGNLSKSGGHILVQGYTFQQIDDYSFYATPSHGLSNVLYKGDIVQFSTQSDPNIYFEIVSLIGNTIVVDKAFDGNSSTYHVTRLFGFRYTIFFDGNAMHTNEISDPGFLPQTEGNFIVSASGSCQPLRAFHNNVLKQISEIPAFANIRVVAAYDGGDNLPGEPTNLSSMQISSSLFSSLPMVISEAPHVTHSLETSDNGVTFTITYGYDDGNVPLFVCNHLSSGSSNATCEANTVMDGNQIGGKFYLDSSDPIPNDASAFEVENAIKDIYGIGNVEVSRSQADGQGGYTWTVTFTDGRGDIPLLRTFNSLTGKGATILVSEIVKGNELGGFYRLMYGPESTTLLPFDASSEAIQSALEELPGIGSVDVNMDSSVDSEMGRTYSITFKHPELGDVELLTPDASQLTGIGGVVFVSEVIKGSLASRDSLYISFNFPRSCSTSNVRQAVCADPINEAVFELVPNSSFSGSPLKITYRPDYSLQIIRTSYPTSVLSSPLSGYFRVSYGGHTSSPLSTRASASDVRIALESLPGIKTAKVERNLASQEVSGICVDVMVGSSTVHCSASCSPCNFGSKGIFANRLVKIKTQWFRVSSSYDGIQESFTIASDHDSFVSKQYVGVSSLRDAILHVWVGGYEWAAFLLSVSGKVQPLTAPVHDMLPPEAALEISTKDCEKCVYANKLPPDTEYLLRGRVKNNRGYSDYSDAIAATPRGIPTAPNNVLVNAVSGECLEVTFGSPIYGEPITSYTVQWDYSELFIHALESSASCSTLRYGNCVVSSVNLSPPFRHEFCGLLDSESYYVRVSVGNGVQVQSIYPSGSPKDNTNWSSPITAEPADQAPAPPTALNALVLGRNGVQILFKWPSRNGGQAISHFVVTYDTSDDFSTAQTLNIESTIPEVIPATGDQLLFDFIPTNPELIAGVRYFIKLAAINNIGKGEASTTISVVPSGPPDPPSAGLLLTFSDSPSNIRETIISWTPPSATGGYPIDGYLVEWWSNRKRPEVQIVQLQYKSTLLRTTFSLSFSPTPMMKRMTSNLPWNASANLVRRELLNLGWDETDDWSMLSDIEVTRTTLARGYQWAITFGNNPDRSLNDGDQVSLVGNVATNGDLGLPSITVSTKYDGQRSNGSDEVQLLQVVGTGTLYGYYRIKFSGSEWTSFIPVHANAAYIKSSLEQLSTVGEVDVRQNDEVDQTAMGTENDVVHHYEVRFMSIPGNVEAMVVDVAHITSSDNNANVLVYNGDNALDSQNTKESAATPGETPLDFVSSGLLSPTTNTYSITGLKIGTVYFVSVSARSPLHGLSRRLIPAPESIKPTVQMPGPPKHVTLNVNTGFSDSLVVTFEPPDFTGGSEILFYRVELDPTDAFDNPIVQDFQCPASNKQTEWKIISFVDGDGVISGGTFTLEIEVDGYTYITSEIPYDAVALASDEIGISEELMPTFLTSDNSNSISTIPPTDIEEILFPGDRLRFSGQSTAAQYFEVVSVTGTSALLSHPFTGDDGVQVSTTRHYGGRGSPLLSRIHCQYDEVLCPLESGHRSGSLQSKLEDITAAIQRGVFVDRNGPSAQNGFTWMVTFLDNARPIDSDYKLRVHRNFLTTFANEGAPQVSVSLLNSGQTYTTCSGSLVIPIYGGLVKGLEYYGRVSARNSEGYSLPVKATDPVAPKVVPGAPTGVTLSVVSSTMLRVLFGSPSDNGGDSITGYLVEWSTSSAFTNVESVSVELLSQGSPFFKNIGGLKTGTYYFVRVKAKNSQGYGVSQISTPSSLNPHQKPSPPTNVRLGITSDTMLTVGWDPPLLNGGDTILKYLLEWDTHPEFSSISEPPNKGYVEVGPKARSYTVELLSPAKNYYIRVSASNTAGGSTYQTATPFDSRPKLQVPGSPYSLQAVAVSIKGRISISWQRPLVPWHGIPCFHEGGNINNCPIPYGGTFPASDGGEDITEYEVEYNERPDFLGTDGGRRSFTGFNAVIDNLYSERTYFVRVLTRNSIGSGKYCKSVSVIPL